MEPYPLVDRKRIIKRYQAGDSTEEIAEDLGYCVAGVRRIRQRYEETGSLLPRSTKPGRKPAFDAQTLDRLAAAGIHLLIEKPLSTSLEGIDRL